MTSPISPTKLRTIATLQRLHTIGIILVFLAIAWSGTATNASGVISEGLIKNVVYLSVASMIVFTLVLAWNVYGIFGFIVSCVLSFVPGINLLVWFMANIQGARVLRKSGVKVGILGAESSTLPSLN